MTKASPSLDDLRKHVLDDAPAPALLRRLLTRQIVLNLTRLHSKPGVGQTGVTASIQSVIDVAAKGSQLSTIEAVNFTDQRNRLLQEMEF